MSADGPASRHAAGDPLEQSTTGRVVAVACGLVRVRVDGRVVRATLGADLLAALARDPEAGPRVGDRVRLRCWCDGPVTVERVVVRPVDR